MLLHLQNSQATFERLHRSGIMRDSQAAVDYIAQHETLRQTPLYLYGQSMGGAVAIDCASRNASLVLAINLPNINILELI